MIDNTNIHGLTWQIQVGKRQIKGELRLHAKEDRSQESEVSSQKNKGHHISALGCTTLYGT